MRDPTDIVELAKCYSQGELTREELENMMRGYPLPVVVHGVNVFAKVFSSDAAAGCVVAAELPLTVDRDGHWSIDEQDERVADFPPE
jgi:hypothetical protein